jgi:asparagine synthase (glutamine-hydrolysing)
MKVGVLFSSGKDSCLALDLVKDKHEVKCLINMQSKNPESYMFHTINVDLVKLQSKSLEIPLVIGKTKGEKEKELEDLEKILRKTKEKYKIEGVISGALYSIYQKKRIENICKRLKLKTISPLWHFGQEKELREIIKRKYEVIIVSVAGEGLGREFLGKKIDEKLVDKLVELNKKIGLNLCFEGGEAETLVLNAPMFKKRIVVDKAKIEMENEFCGSYVIKKTHLEK